MQTPKGILEKIISAAEDMHTRMTVHDDDKEKISKVNTLICKARKDLNDIRTAIAQSNGT